MPRVDRSNSATPLVSAELLLRPNPTRLKPHEFGSGKSKSAYVVFGCTYASFVPPKVIELV